MDKGVQNAAGSPLVVPEKLTSLGDTAGAAATDVEVDVVVDG